MIKSVTHPHTDETHSKIMNKVPERVTNTVKQAQMHDTPIGVANTGGQTKKVSRTLNKDVKGTMH